MTRPSHVLLVAQKTAAAGALAAVARRAMQGPAHFTLLVPAVAHGLHWAVGPEDQCCEEAELVVAAARPRLEAAA